MQREVGTRADVCRCLAATGSSWKRKEFSSLKRATVTDEHLKTKGVLTSIRYQEYLDIGRLSRPPAAAPTNSALVYDPHPLDGGGWRMVPGF